MLGLGSSVELAIIGNLSPFLSLAAYRFRLLIPKSSGLVLTSSAGGVQAATRSLITEKIREEDINVVYSVFTILQRISSALAGPVYSSTYAVGVKMGGDWSGLPFFVASMTAAISAVMLHQAQSPSNYEPVLSEGIDSEDT